MSLCTTQRTKNEKPTTLRIRRQIHGVLPPRHRSRCTQAGAALPHRRFRPHAGRARGDDGPGSQVISCFCLLREEVLRANTTGVKIPIPVFEQELLDCFCRNEIAGFNALSNSLVETPGLEQYASAASRAMSAWLIALETVHAAAKH